MESVSEYFQYFIYSVGVLWILRKSWDTALSIVSYYSKKRMLKRWRKTPKDVLIVHRFPSAKTCPNGSPFVVKLETYLRMADIPYVVDEKDYMSVKGKCPWISLNGEHVADSQLCIEYLAKKFNKKIGNYSESDRALGSMARILMDEHFYWGILLWRYIYTKGADCHKIFDANKFLLNLAIRLMRGRFAAAAYSQGVGRHEIHEVIEIMSQDLRTISTFLGNKRFILGDEPCEDDAGVFGELSQIVWCCPDSPFEGLVNGELRNLKDYCERMKARFWPDWDDWLAGARNKQKKQ